MNEAPVGGSKWLVLCPQYQTCELSENANKASKELSNSFLVFLNKCEACTAFNYFNHSECTDFYEYLPYRCFNEALRTLETLWPLSVVPCDRSRDIGQKTETQESPWPQEILFCEGNQALGQVAQRGVDPSLSETFQSHPDKVLGDCF